MEGQRHTVKRKKNGIIKTALGSLLTPPSPQRVKNQTMGVGGGNHPTKFTPRCDKKKENMINVLSVPKSLGYYG